MIASLLATVIGSTLLVWPTGAALDATPKFSTGNLSVDAITHSPIGAHSDPAYQPELPSLESLRALKNQGLWAYEDYIAWGMVEPKEGAWDWSHHEAVYRRVTDAGLVYIPYLWCHYPPLWLRSDSRATLMRCNNGGGECTMLSIYDPRTLEWYKRFYAALKAHFDARLDEVYACFLGPYAEGNYPLPYANFVLDVGTCPDGQYWCGDRYALPQFQQALKKRYGTIGHLNQAWQSQLTDFSDVAFPAEIATGQVPRWAERPPTERRRWLDFIYWYHQALNDFCAGSVDVVASVFGKSHVAAKPGGNCGGMNPVSWGTYNPGFAKMAGRKGIALQSADSRGAYWADKWTSTAYAFYGVPYRTEAAGGLDEKAFAQRTFTDVSCGASRLFSYELDKHMPACQKSLPLFTGERGRTDVALLAPTTLHYLNGDVAPAIEAGMRLRDRFDYDVVDELLVRDGILAKNRYRVLIAMGCPVVEAETFRRIEVWTRRGGLLLWAAETPVQSVEGLTRWRVNEAAPDGTPLGKGWAFRTAADPTALADASTRLVYHSDELPHGPAPLPLLDGESDQVWTTQRSRELLFINLGEVPIDKTFQWEGVSHTVHLPPFQFIEDVIGERVRPRTTKLGTK